MYNQEEANRELTSISEESLDNSMYPQASEYIFSNLLIIIAIIVFVILVVIRFIFKLFRKRGLFRGKQKREVLAKTPSVMSKQEKDSREEIFKNKQVQNRGEKIQVSKVSVEAEDFTIRENVIERVYSMDWKRDGFSEPMDQYSSSIGVSKSIASMFYGDEARQEISTLLFSIITMYRQGLSEVQISRILASTKLLNPNIDSRMLQEAADFYLKILEEFNISEGVSRYSGQINTYVIPHTDKEVMRFLSKGDISLFMEVFDSYSLYKQTKASGLPKGHLSLKFLSEAADLKLIQSRILFAEDIDLSYIKANEGLGLFPEHGGSFIQLAEISLSEGRLEEAQGYYQKVIDIEDIKKDTSVYMKARTGLAEISALREKENKDQRLLAYHLALSAARLEVRKNIHNFFALNEERKMFLA